MVPLPRAEGRRLTPELRGLARGPFVAAATTRRPPRARPGRRPAPTTFAAPAPPPANASSPRGSRSRRQVAARARGGSDALTVGALAREDEAALTSRRDVVERGGTMAARTPFDGTPPAASASAIARAVGQRASLSKARARLTAAATGAGRRAPPTRARAPVASRRAPASPYPRPRPARAPASR